MSPMGMYGNSMPPLGMSNGMFYGMNGNFNMMDQSKGKGKSREADFEAAFAQITASLQEQTSRIEEVQDDVAGIVTDMEKAMVDDGKVSESETDFKKYVNTLRSSCRIFNWRFLRVWEELQTSELPPPIEDMAKWEAEFNQLMSSQRDELETDYGTSMQQAWESGLGDLSSGTVHGDRLEFDDEGVPILNPYVFGLYFVSSLRIWFELLFFCREEQQICRGIPGTFTIG